MVPGQLESHGPRVHGPRSLNENRPLWCCGHIMVTYGALGKLFIGLVCA